MAAEWTKLTPLERFFMDETVPHNPVIITAFVTLTSCPSEQWIYSTLMPRLLTHPRFSARIATPPNGEPSFEHIPDFTAQSSQLREHHVVHEPIIDLSLPHNKRNHLFQHRLSQIISEPLCRHRPLWRLHVFPMWSIEPLSQHTQCATLIFRIHHVVADGIGLIKYVMSQIADQHTARGADQLVVPSRQRQPSQSSNARKMPSTPAAPSSLLYHMLVRSWVAFSTNVYAVVGTLVPEKDNTFVRSQLQPNKVCAVLPPSVYTVSALKHAARSLGITINDLLYTAVSGATRSYLSESGDDVDALSSLRVGVPYNNHAIQNDGAQDLCNRFALMTLPLHVHHRELQQRLTRCVETMRIVKCGMTPVLLTTLLQIVCRLPEMLRRAVWRRLTRSGSLVFTNVPGPKEAVSVGGIRVSGLHFLAPSDGHCGVVVGMHSYNGQICIGVYGDQGRVSNPKRFVELLDDEIKALIRVGDVKF